MADHTPPLESGQLLSPDLPLLTSPPPPSLVNGDGAQQVILVQVNPGEAFTIQREDGQFQCITGPAQVPMMSPNGSVPPIYVPPGYVQQIIEENGVRRVLVLPQAEFHPGGHSPLHHPPPPPPHAHLQAFIPHPHHPIMPHPSHLYSGMAGGTGDMNPQYISQYHPAHIYSEQVSTDTHPPHGRTPFVHRDERANKTYERLQKKLKERQGGQAGGGGGLVPSKDSPPLSPQKNRGTPPGGGDLQNGVGLKGVEEQSQASAAVTSLGMECQGRGRDMEPAEMNEKMQAIQEWINNMSKPVVTDIQARGASLCWVAPVRTAVEEEQQQQEEGEEKSEDPCFSYEVSVSYSGKDGKYNTAYSGKELSATIDNLRPATDYHVRLQAMCNCLHGTPSEPASFTTLSCEPDTPSPPRKASGTKSTLVLQWKAPCDNGSKIQNYILHWDEGKGTGAFEQCYYGPQKQYRVTKLSPASKYSFRLAAKNDMGISEFSEPVDMMTSCSVPAPPLSPELVQAGVTWICLKWNRPVGSPKEDEINYVLEMEEEGSGYGFQPSFDGDELSCTVRNLHRSTKYKFRVAAYNAEGKSNPSPVSEFTTAPDRPSCPCRPSVKGKPHPTSFRMTWDPPKDNGGSDVSEYVVEMSEAGSGSSWEQVYRGSAMECVCDGLKPGCSYQAKVYCLSVGGQSPMSETLQVQLPAVPPGPCQPPRVVGKPKAREVQLRWASPQVDGGSAVCSYSVEVFAPQAEEGKEVYQGSDLDCTVCSLLPGRSYGFRLRAANKAGYGPYSERTEVTTGPGAPEPCRPPHVVCKSPSCAVVSWEAPPCNGAAVTEYRLEWGAAEGSMQVCFTGPGTSHELKGLLPATNYFCRVQAVNVAGVGPFSDVVLCQTPCSVPAAVSSVHALRESEMRMDDRGSDRGEEEEEEEEEDEEGEDEGDAPSPPLYSPSTCLGLRWEAPCDHGAEITSYLIDIGERQPILTGPVTKYIIQNLQPDTSYRIRIQALNSLGAGPFSHTFKLKTKPLPPLPPRLECTAFSHQTLRLKWGEGPTKGTPTDSLQYHLQLEDKNGRFISLYKGPCHTHKVQRLNESTSYTFRIQAFNEAGEGPFSSVYTFTTPRSPPAPLKAPRVERLEESCEISWEALPPMKGDPVIYCLQCMQGNSEFKQIYKGSATVFQLPSLSSSAEYRFRVCGIRQCQDAPEIIGPYSSTVTLLPPRIESPSTSTSTGPKAAEIQRPRRSLSDEQFSFLIIALLAVTSILIAVAIQYFVIE
ncbi:fibronectin type-III domain-containing protein 3a isoform X1 [Astyanax mexicanus]|uniref:fibronectin type-III domain-containing protein 3a isoform X1 n=1 Tax=Astyanax mexicanus TaxID=7994 RepID=UPI0020CABCA5|nr:fibronectin type-III domain-containing protein 3a isoform X1 [Astyanax mexicanus]XP_007236780.3 fibronectin type-III domain-containing protein 3a isoform X1 [Astyanax mexicanus]